MGTNTGTIMTLANSIIGVSVLAMPFCFKQCGIALSILMLIASSVLSRLACHFLLKSAVMARRRTFEFLAFHTFGVTGKFAVELFIIGFLMGTCIAFFVVMGDLGPAILAKILGLSNTIALRPSVLIGLAVFVVLPLGMLRNVDSLSSVSMATIGFYICLVLKVVGESLPHLLAGDWYQHVNFWRPAGILQCIPIFSMALFCQTQLFEIYESMHNASLDRMNFVIRAACNICTGVYICVGFFGYIAFCTQPFTGNVLMSFTPSIVSEMIKLGFVLSVAVSFPLVIFPCRASLYSLLFRRISMPHHEGVSSHIPEARFKCLTVFIISITLVIGLLIPNIELVLGLVGSTIGVLICVMFPAAAFICMSSKSSGDRVLAQVLLFIGALILVLGTYATLNSANETRSPTEILNNEPAARIVEKTPHFHEKVDNALVDVPPKLEQNSESNVKEFIEEHQEPINVALDVKAPVQPKDAQGDVSKTDKRQEPPVPVEPAVDQLQPSAIPPVVEEKVVVRETENEIEHKVIHEEDKGEKHKEKNGENTEENKKDLKSGGSDQVHQDAIKKEDEELAEAEKRDDKINKDKNEEILRKLEKHEAQQMKILQEQKQILQALQEHQERDLLKEQQENAVKNLSLNKSKEILEQAQLKIPLNQVKIEAKESQETAKLSADKHQSPEKKKHDLLQQIANGELKKVVVNSLPQNTMNLVNNSQPKQILLKKATKSVSGVTIEKSYQSKNEPAVAEIKESFNVIVPNVQLNPVEAAPPVPALLLERLKSPPLPLALNSKTESFIAPPSKAQDVPLEAEEERKAMRREILQEPVVSTLASTLLTNTKNASLDVKQSINLPEKEPRQELHEREKRDIEKDSLGNVIVKVINEHNRDQLNINNEFTTLDLQNCHVTERSESSELKSKDLYKEHGAIPNPDIGTNAQQISKGDQVVGNNIGSSNNKAKIVNPILDILPVPSAGSSTKHEDKVLGSKHLPLDNSNHTLQLNSASKDMTSDMIKSATHLSDPEVKSNEENEVSVIKKSVSPDAKPMKRDLKSISLN